ncbi:MAG TPA: NmrA family transcriptional regulator, partial [Pseudonocardia sp.]
FDEKDFADLVRSGTVALPAGPVTEPYVDADDVADVAVAALTQDGHAGRVLEVTGPRLLTFADAVAEIAAATGRAVEYRRVTPAEFTAGLHAAGVPDDLAAAVTDVFATVLDGRGSSLTGTVEAVLGRPPRDFAAYARAAASRGAWDAPVPTGR